MDGCMPLRFGFVRRDRSATNGLPSGRSLMRGLALRAGRLLRGSGPCICKAVRSNVRCEVEARPRIRNSMFVRAQRHACLCFGLLAFLEGIFLMGFDAPPFAVAAIVERPRRLEIWDLKLD